MLTTEKLNAFAKTWGFNFKSPIPLIEAFTHTSYAHEAGSATSNERLEFLGDSVLGLIITEKLYTRHGELAEGQLSKLKSHAVNEETLANLARHINLGSYLLLGKGEQKSIEEKDAILADAFEALLGAVYLDGGIAAAKTFFDRVESSLGVDLLDPKHLIEFDAKSRLQEYCLKSWQELPTYQANEVRPGFQVTLVVHGKPLLSTQNISKKKAETFLAQACLKHQLHLTLGDL